MATVVDPSKDATTALCEQMQAEVLAIEERKLEQRLTWVIRYSGVFLGGAAAGYVLFLPLEEGLRLLDPSVQDVNLDEISQPLQIVITAIAIAYGNLLATTLGFLFGRMQSIR